MSAALRSEPFHFPGAIANAAITQAIMQAMLALLPEFDFVRTDKIASPVFWTRRSIRILRFQFRKFLFQHGAGRDHFTLRRYRCAESAAGGAGVEVGLRFFGARFHHPAGDPNL